MRTKTGFVTPKPWLKNQLHPVISWSFLHTGGYSTNLLPRWCLGDDIPAGISCLSLSTSALPVCMVVLIGKQWTQINLLALVISSSPFWGLATRLASQTSTCVQSSWQGCFKCIHNWPLHPFVSCWSFILRTEYLRSYSLKSRELIQRWHWNLWPVYLIICRVLKSWNVYFTLRVLGKKSLLWDAFIRYSCFKSRLINRLIK